MGTSENRDERVGKDDDGGVSRGQVVVLKA